MREDLVDAFNLFTKESFFKPELTDYRHLVLIPDQNCQPLPWESLPILRDLPVSRVTSYAMLEACLRNVPDIKKEHSFMILNPSGDLIRTQKRFENIIEGSWTSIIGKTPSQKEFMKGLADNALFMYFGHGGGESYLSQHSLPKLGSVPVALLFGCSSGRLKPHGQFNSTGIAIDYLQAGRFYNF